MVPAMLITLIYLLVDLAILGIMYYLVVWLLGMIVGLPPFILVLVKVVFVCLALVIVFHFLIGLTSSGGVATHPYLW